MSGDANGVEPGDRARNRDGTLDDPARPRNEMRSLLLRPEAFDRELPRAELEAIVGEIAGVPRVELRILLEDVRGILAISASEDRVGSAVEALARLGIAAASGPAPLPLPPRGLRIVAATLGEQFIGRTPLGDSLVVPWPSIRAIGIDAESAGRESEPRREAAVDFSALGSARPDGPSTPRTRPEASATLGKSPRASRFFARAAELGLADVSLRLSIHTSADPRVVRIRRESFDYSVLGEQKVAHSFDNFLFLIEEVLARAPSIWNRDSCERFTRNPDPESILRTRPVAVARFESWVHHWIEEEARAVAPGSPGSAAASGDEAKPKAHG
jgi:hypothetical protein